MLQTQSGAILTGARLHPRLSRYISRLGSLGLYLGISNPIVVALNTLFKGLQTDGLITSSPTPTGSDLIQYANIFPYHSSGANANTVVEPLWRPTGTTGTNNGFVTGDLTLTGMLSSGTKRYDSGIKPSNVMTLESSHLALYITNYTGGTATRSIGSASTYGTYSGNNDAKILMHGGTEQSFTGLSFTTKNFLVWQRNAGNLQFNLNGATQSIAIGDTTAPSTTDNLFFGNNPAGTTPIIDSYGWESCGYALSSAQIAALKSRIETFNTAIGR